METSITDQATAGNVGAEHRLRNSGRRLWSFFCNSMGLNLSSIRQRWFSYRSSVKLALRPLQAVPVRMLRRVDCTVSPVAFLPDEIEEQFNRVFLLLEVMNL
jgi:hypothetical protein